MTKKIDRFTEKEIFHLNAKEIIGTILLFILLELFFIIIFITVFDSIPQRIVSIIVLNIILIITIFGLLLYKPNLLFLQSNQGWKAKREAYLLSQLAYYKKGLLLIDVNPDENIDNELQRLNKILIDKDKKIEELKSICDQTQKKLENEKSQIVKLQNTLDDLGIELEKKQGFTKKFRGKNEKNII